MRYSVITINFNNADGLRKTIKSVVSQTSNDYEYIIIDGGSSDGSVDVIKEYAGKIHYWVSERDKGIYNAMNKGIAQAHGDYCIFMNSGDVFFNDNVLEDVSDIGCNDDIFVGVSVSTKDGSIISPAPLREISLYHLFYGGISHQASFIKTILLQNNPYDESLKIVSDWKFFVEEIIMNNCSFHYIDIKICKYDVEGVSSVNLERSRTEKVQVLQSLLPERVIHDYQYLKATECLTQTLATQLKNNYGIDRIMFMLGKMLLKFFGKK